MAGEPASLDESSMKPHWTLSAKEIRFVPDPSAQLSDGKLKDFDAGRIHGSRWLNQTQRRAAILAAARQLFSQNGYDRFHVRELAGMCELSAQTIYNLVGDKERVLHDAMREHVTAMVTSAAKVSDRYPNFLLASGDTFWATAARYPEYSRQMSISYNYSSRSFFDVVNDCTLPPLHLALSRLQLRHRLRERVDPRVITDRLAALGAVSILHWAEGRRSVDELRQDIALGWGLILLGAVESHEQSRIEDWLASLMSSRWEQPLTTGVAN